MGVGVCNGMHWSGHEPNPLFKVFEALAVLSGFFDAQLVLFELRRSVTAYRFTGKAIWFQEVLLGPAKDRPCYKHLTGLRRHSESETPDQMQPSGAHLEPPVQGRFDGCGCWTRPNGAPKTGGEGTEGLLPRRISPRRRVLQRSACGSWSPGHQCPLRAQAFSRKVGCNVGPKVEVLTTKRNGETTWMSSQLWK